MKYDIGDTALEDAVEQQDGCSCPNCGEDAISWTVSSAVGASGGLQCDGCGYAEGDIDDEDRFAAWPEGLGLDDAATEGMTSVADAMRAVIDGLAARKGG